MEKTTLIVYLMLDPRGKSRRYQLETRGDKITIATCSEQIRLLHSRKIKLKSGRLQPKEVILSRYSRLDQTNQELDLLPLSTLVTTRCNSCLLCRDSPMSPIAASSTTMMILLNCSETSSLREVREESLECRGSLKSWMTMEMVNLKSKSSGKRSVTSGFQSLLRRVVNFSTYLTSTVTVQYPTTS